TRAGETAVAYGGNITYTFTPDEGYKVKDVKVDGVSVGASNSYTFHNVTENHTIYVEFEVITFVINATAGENGTITRAGETTVAYGGNIAYTFTPDEGYKVKDVKVDGVSIGAVESYTFDDVTDNHSIAVEFEIITFTINGSTDGNGTISPNGDTSVEYGDDITYIFTPNLGYKIKNVKVDGESVGADVYYTFTDVVEDHTIAVEFEIITFIVSASAGENGTITPAGNITVDYGEEITFTFMPDEGYKVKDVKLDGESIGKTMTCRFVGVSKNHTISVSFEKDSYTLTATASTYGTITPNGDTSVIYGEDITYTFTPYEGYEVKDVRVDGVSVGAVESYTFNDVNDHHNIYVEFGIKQFSVTISTIGKGDVNSNGPLDVISYGDSVVLTIEANEGWELSAVYVNETEVNVLGNILVLRDVDSNIHVEVVFTEKVSDNNGSNIDSNNSNNNINTGDNNADSNNGSENDTDNDNDMVWIIVISVIAGLLLIVVLVLSYEMARHRRKK
ncbi:MAG: hypothetical protein J6V77_00740, partial [Clostridia bacterium]|nr:hypothetical protein [Clostridia bacterium]